jgi:recombination protein RecT
MNKLPVVQCEEILKVKEQAFNEIAITHDAVTFKKESFFALDLLSKNDFLMKVAIQKPQSVQAAIMNVASIGLSLNPASSHCYLLPRKGQVCLDISYRGLLKLATDAGSISFVVAEVVFKNDDFIDNGIGERPTHKRDSFSNDRGEIVGAYCTAKTNEGDFLTTVMSIKDIYEIRNKSEAYKRKSGPWAVAGSSDEREMIKKTVIKRAAKTWPASDRTKRLDEAILVANESEGYESINNGERDVTPPSETAMTMLVDALTQIPEKDGKSSTERLLGHCQAKYRRVVENIDDLNADEVNYCISFLKQYNQ